MIQQCSDTSSPQHSRPTNGQATADVALVFRATTIGLHTYYDIQELQLAKKMHDFGVKFRKSPGGNAPRPNSRYGVQHPLQSHGPRLTAYGRGLKGSEPPIGNQKFSSNRGITIMSCLCVRYLAHGTATVQLVTAYSPKRLSVHDCTRVQCTITVAIPHNFKNLTEPFPRCTAYNFLVQKAPKTQQETPSSALKI